ncbi:hypothetical protein ACLOJK_039437 [Asimina triloba]
MVCEKCEKKLGKVIVPDKWKEGASNTNESGGRKINENKLLSKKNRDFSTSMNAYFEADLSGEHGHLPSEINAIIRYYRIPNRQGNNVEMDE